MHDFTDEELSHMIALLEYNPDAFDDTELTTRTLDKLLAVRAEARAIKRLADRKVERIIRAAFERGE